MNHEDFAAHAQDRAPQGERALPGDRAPQSDHAPQGEQAPQGERALPGEYAPQGEQAPQGVVPKTSQRDGTDGLTGLPDMARFRELAMRGAQSMRERGQRPAAIALDLLDMKGFNVEYGREAGDELLRAFADALRKSFGSEACARFAKDHFYAFASEDTVEKRLEQLFEDFRNSSANKSGLPVRAGAYVCDEGDQIVSVGFDRARIACDMDRNTWESHAMRFTDEMRAETKLRLHVLDCIDQALQEGWVRPHYQAIVRAATSDICGEEALARWVDPLHGELAPSQFIPVLEDAGLLHKLDMHMIDCVLRDLQVKQAAGIPMVSVSVNVSLDDLRYVDIAAEVIRRADQAGIPHALLAIEFTESSVSSDPEAFRAQSAALREAGFEVWMDDFGSGYSSLNTLQEFDFDVIKLDMGFIKGIHSKKARSIIAGVIRIADALGIATLAEGVETEEQATFLESVGCDMIQGYYFVKPMPLDRVVGRAQSSTPMPREALVESSYWDAVDTFCLADAAVEATSASADEIDPENFPAGVFERRGDEWRLLRANRPFREFLENSNVLAPGCSPLVANPVQADNMDAGFFAAIDKSAVSKSWEMIVGTLELGTGLQFYARQVSTEGDAEAYAIASTPTMLGSALGSYGDVPVAYAVFRVIFDEAHDKVDDVVYVYANDEYRKWGGYGDIVLTGESFRKVNKNANFVWFESCYRVVTTGQPESGLVYSPILESWMNYSMAPSPMHDCLVFAFMRVNGQPPQE